MVKQFNIPKELAFDREKRYEVVMLSEQPYLFIDDRLIHSTIPSGMYVYEVSDAGDSACFVIIQERTVREHFWGTLIGSLPLPCEDGAYLPAYGSHDFEGNYLDEWLTFSEYLAKKDWDIPEEPDDGELFCRSGGDYIGIFEATAVCVPSFTREQLEEAFKKDFYDVKLKITSVDTEMTGCGRILPGTSALITLGFRISDDCPHGGIRTFELPDMFSVLDGIDIYAAEVTKRSYKKGNKKGE